MIPRSIDGKAPIEYGLEAPNGVKSRAVAPLGEWRSRVEDGGRADCSLVRRDHGALIAGEHSLTMRVLLGARRIESRFDSAGRPHNRH